MATASTMAPLGTMAPDFELETFDGDTVSRRAFEGKPLLVMFLCNHCPYVKHVESQLGSLCKEYRDKGLAVVAIQSNDIEAYPADGPEGMREQSGRASFTFPYLLDPTQDVAKAYGAACTPDFFVFDSAHKLAYRGQMDDSRPRSGTPVTGADLRVALDAVLEGRKPPAQQQPSMGCNIKFRPGNEPG